MKLYDSIGPNPKIVRMFAAEKGFAFKETVKVDLRGGENRKEPYLAKNPAGGLPCVELDGGKIIAETISHLRADRGNETAAGPDRRQCHRTGRDPHVDPPRRMEDHPADHRRFPLLRGACGCSRTGCTPCRRRRPA